MCTSHERGYGEGTAVSCKSEGFDDEWRSHYNKINLSLFYLPSIEEPVKYVTGRGNVTKFASAQKPDFEHVDIFTYDIGPQSWSLEATSTAPDISTASSSRSAAPVKSRGEANGATMSKRKTALPSRKAVEMSPEVAAPVQHTRSGRTVTRTKQFGC